MHHISRLAFVSLVGIQALTMTTITNAQDSVADEMDYTLTKDIEYATVDGHSLLLDLYLPKPELAKQSGAAPQLIVWVHGGAWRSGSKSSMPLKWLLKDGYAIASVDYRLSPVARFPAQIHDCKAAIRFLRASASKYGYVAERVGIAGASAGGHLVALMGVTNGRQAGLEGRVGGRLEHSSDVQAVVDYYGPTNFMTILQQSTPHGLSVRVPALQLLLGDEPEDTPELAKRASPVFHMDKRAAPLLMLHGDQDPQVPINQSHELHGAYKQFEIDVQMEVVHGGVHGGDLFYDERRRELVRTFLHKQLRP